MTSGFGAAVSLVDMLRKASSSRRRAALAKTYADPDAGAERSIALPAGHDAPYVDAILAWHDATGPHDPEHRVAAL